MSDLPEKTSFAEIFITERPAPVLLERHFQIVILNLAGKISKSAVEFAAAVAITDFQRVFDGQPDSKSLGFIRQFPV